MDTRNNFLLNADWESVKNKLPLIANIFAFIRSIWNFFLIHPAQDKYYKNTIPTMS